MHTATATDETGRGGDRSSQVLERTGPPPLPGAVLISQGAEARVYRVRFLGREAIVKERFSKAYRHPELDAKLNNARLVQEARCLVKGRGAGVNVPAVYFVESGTRHPSSSSSSSNRLYLEFVPGWTVKDFLLQHGTQCPEATEAARKVGQAVAQLHEANVIHGDLTTSNMIIKDDHSIVIIDFGLSFMTRNHVEDAAVDLYVLERALLSTHPSSETLFSCFLEEYSKHTKKASSVLTRLDEGDLPACPSLLPACLTIR